MPPAVLVEQSVEATIAGVTSTTAAIDAALTAASLPLAVIGNISLALDEILTNIVSHGSTGRQVDLVVVLDGDMVVAEVVDDGPEFDPLSLPAPDVGASLEDRAIGGLGVHLVRSLMDDVRYRHDGKRNRLTLVKYVRDRPAPD